MLLAQLQAETAFDINKFNLNFHVRYELSAEYFDAIKVRFAGRIYEDMLRVSSAGPGRESILTFLGPSIIVDGGNKITGGAVTAFTELDQASLKGYGIAGFELAGSAFRDAMSTVSRADDIALLRSILSGADTLSLSAFADRAAGYDGADKISGNGGADTISGGAGQDTLSGGTNRDKLFGGDGGDLLVGGSGGDSLWGGRGSDKFIYNSPAEGGDAILDFGTSDFIGVSSAGFGGLPKGRLDPLRFVVSEGVHALTPKDRFIFDVDDGKLWYDSNGTGKGGQFLIADFNIKFLLTPDDIFVI